MTGVAHYTDLVDGFKQDHRQLLKAFGAVKQSLEAQDAAGFKQDLQIFETLLVPHLVTEGVKLYTYLRQHLKAQGALEDYARVSAYKAEMAHIGDIALHFIETYAGLPAEKINFPQVQEELHAIGLQLGDRIRREESDLYCLYEKST